MKLKVGLIGCGGIAHAAHFPALKRIEEVEIVAVCDINQQKLDAVKLEGVKKYLDYKQMIDSEKLDFIDICTPNYLHSEIAIYALDKGINVFCEKPDAISVEAALAMQAAEKASGKTLMIMRNNRFGAASRELKQKCDAGEMGDIYAGRCGWIRRRGIPGKGGWFTNKAQSGGGPLIDLGVHMIDLAIYLMGNPKAVAVSGSTFTKFADSDESDSVHSKFGEKVDDGVFDVEDLAMGFIKFDNGACLQIEFSWASNIKKEVNFVELRGSKSGFKWQWLTYEEYGAKKQNAISRSLKKLKHLKGFNGHYGNLRHFVDVLTKGEKPIFTMDQGVNMIKILTGIYESAKTGREVIL